MDNLESKRGEIAIRLRAAREQAGLSQGQVAKMLDYQRPTISEIEAGRRKASAEEIARLAEIYDVSPDWLLHDRPAMADPKVELAARELSKLKSEDLDTVLKLLRTLKKSDR